MPTIKVAYNRSKAVFVGKALSESKEGDIRTFNFQVEKYWKGATKKNITVNVYETMRYQAGFIVGERYLVFTHLRDDGKLYDARCSGTKLLSQASIDVRELGRAKTPSR